MKIEIDLNEIFEGESLKESITRQCEERLMETLEKQVQDKIDHKVSETIETILKGKIEELLPGLISNLIDSEYSPVEKWGEKKKPTTIRRELINILHAELMIEKDYWGSRNESKIQKTIRELADSQLKQFREEFTNLLDKEVVKEAYKYAEEKFRERFGIKT